MRTPSTLGLSASELEVLMSDAAGLIGEWVFSSSSPDAIAMKISVMSEFGMTAVVHNPYHHTIDAKRIAWAQRVVRYIYECTQEALSADHTETIELFRGIEKPQFVTGGIQSWTKDIKVAKNFDGYDVLQENVPANRVLAFYGGPHWKSGLLLPESEYIILATVKP